MIRILAALVVIVALVLILYDREENTPAQASDQKIETGWGDLDSLISDNLSDGTQSTIAGTFNGSASMLRGWGSDAVSEFRETAAED
jgi:hypothetical protein